jgi:hypothetical protein
MANMPVSTYDQDSNTRSFETACQELKDMASELPIKSFRNYHGDPTVVRIAVLLYRDQLRDLIASISIR